MNELKTLFGAEIVKEDKCLSEFKTCKPLVKSKSKKFNLNNHMVFEMKHCSCTITFYRCLKTSLNSFYKKIGHIYFNLINTKCFHYEYRKKCSFYFLGRCLLSGDFNCHIKLVKVPLF